MSVEVITESDFLWYSVGTFAQNYLKQSQKMKKLLNQLNNFCYQNEWPKLVAHCLKSISKLLKKHVAGTYSHKKARNTKIIKSIQNFCDLRT